MQYSTSQATLTRLSIALAVIFGAVTVYSVVHQKEADIVFDLVGATDLIGLRRPVRKLSILVDGKDVQEEGLNLRMYTVEMRNEGEVHILQSDFDAGQPWGLKVENGKVIEVRLAATGSEYLSQNLQPETIGGESAVSLRKCIVERGDFAVLELLILHQANVTPRIRPMGKIAGVPEKDPLQWRPQHTRSGLLARTFAGGFAEQVLRAMGYLVFWILAFVSVGSVVAIIGTRRTRKAEAGRRSVFAARRAAGGFTDEATASIVELVFTQDGTRLFQAFREQLDAPGPNSALALHARALGPIDDLSVLDRRLRLLHGGAGVGDLVRALLSTGAVTLVDGKTLAMTTAFARDLDALLGN